MMLLFPVSPWLFSLARTQVIFVKAEVAQELPPSLLSAWLWYLDQMCRTSLTSWYRHNFAHTVPQEYVFSHRDTVGMHPGLGSGPAGGSTASAETSTIPLPLNTCTSWDRHVQLHSPKVGIFSLLYSFFTHEWWGTQHRGTVPWRGREGGVWPHVPRHFCLQLVCFSFVIWFKFWQLSLIILHLSLFHKNALFYYWNEEVRSTLLWSTKLRTGEGVYTSDNQNSVPPSCRGVIMKQALYKSLSILSTFFFPVQMELRIIFYLKNEIHEGVGTTAFQAHLVL